MSGRARGSDGPDVPCSLPNRHSSRVEDAKKPPEAGAAVLFSGNKVTPLKPNPGTEEKPHGAFFAFTEGEFSGSTFAHAPNGVLPPVREGGPQANCDGKGLDSLEVCFEGSE